VVGFGAGHDGVARPGASARVLTAECSRRGHGRTRVARLGGVFAAECCDRAKFRALTKGSPCANQPGTVRASNHRNDEGGGHGDSLSVARVRPGEAAEAALYAALTEAGFVDFVAREGVLLHNEPDEHVFVRQLPFGAYLEPPRRFCADVGFPVARLLVEIEGHAHSVKKQRSHDVRRRQLAEAGGWRVLSVLPEQVMDGTAIELVRAALAAGRATT
jgi:very-short-patch-repair endonuclease